MKTSVSAEKADSPAAPPVSTAGPVPKTSDSAEKTGSPVFSVSVPDTASSAGCAAATAGTAKLPAARAAANRIEHKRLTTIRHRFPDRYLIFSLSFGSEGTAPFSYLLF